jgi:hypothetical protein
VSMRFAVANVSFFSWAGNLVLTRSVETCGVALRADPGVSRATREVTRRRRSPLRRLIPGGPAGNEQLTAATGVVLLVLLAVLGVTILRIGQLLNVHMFLGMLLIGPVALKIASTGYRFIRYYTADPPYRRKGPPSNEMRLLAPLVVVSTVVVFASGVALLVAGPSSRGTLLPLHKVSFAIWLLATGVHVLGHLAEMPDALRADRRRERQWDDYGSGRGARAVVLAMALVGGLVLALLAESQFGLWANFVRHLQ